MIAESSSNTKKWYLFGLAVFLFAILFSRLFLLQVTSGEHYFNMSEENRIRVVPVPAPRGLIFDRNGNVLVDNRPSYTIAIIPFQLKDVEKTISKFSTVLSLDPGEIERKISARKARPYEPVKLERDVGIDAVSVIEENRYELPGVIYQVEPRRRYPFGRLAAHILGYVGELSDEEFSKLQDKGYLLGELIGKTGIEKEYERFLRGVNGVRYLEVDALGREIRELGKKLREPKPGFKLHLTIDWGIQKASEQAFGEGMRGGLVAIAPRTGEILAMVSRPEFDPGLFSGVLAPEVWNSLNVNPQHPLLNRAVQSAYPPGSILKMVTAIAGLELDLIDKDSKFAPCTGSFKFGNRWYGCWEEQGHGVLDVSQAIVQSCDIFFYQLGLKVGLENWGRYAEELGLEKRTGVDLPAEARGLVPSGAYYDQRYGKGKWTRGLLLNLSVGQGEILVTPIQMACYIAAIATGELPQPHLLRKVTSQQGQLVFQPRINTRKIDVSPATLQLIRQALLEAVEGEKGTGRLARVGGVHVAGKTGTAQNPHGKDHAWFVAYAPFEDPAIAVAAVVEEGGHGASAAAPLVQKVLTAAVNGYGHRINPINRMN